MLLQQQRERESEGDITNTPFDTDTMAPLLNANTVILPQQTHQPTLPPPPSSSSSTLLLMEESHGGKSPALNAN